MQTVPRRGYRFIAPVDVVAVCRHRRQRAERPGCAAVRPERVIAVSDFPNVTGDANDAWMAAGIAETVTNDLRRSAICA